jgi:secondary thiamine-phosphate synthase enzyme
MSTITVSSKAHDEVIDITAEVAGLVTSLNGGLCSLFVEHTTCALTVLTNEMGIAEDLLSVLRDLVPKTGAYVHDSVDHVRAHVLAALVGPSVSVPVRDGRLGLGRFQRIVLVEFEGPRQRTIEVDLALTLGREGTET